AGAKGALPPEAHLLDRGGCGIGTYVLRGAGAVRLTKGVATGDERDRLLVGHPHSGKGLADLLSRSQGIRLAVGALGVDVDEAHLSGRQGAFELAVFLTLVAEPLSLFAPVNVLLRLPDVLAAASKPDELDSHRLQGNVAREDHEVSPGDLLAVLLFNRPKQAARLVQVDVVGPAVERGKALAAALGAPAAVAGAVGARAVPGHADKERPVVPKVGRPPVLRVGHQSFEVFFEGPVIEAQKLLGVIVVLAHGVGLRRVLVENLEVKLLGPPVLFGRPTALDRHAAGHRALAVFAHELDSL